MPRALTAKQMGIDGPCWKVRIIVTGGLIHVLSSTEPRIVQGDFGPPELDWTPIESKYGDTVGYMDWAAVKSVTWREA